MPRSKKRQKKPEKEHTYLAVRVDHHDASITAGVNSDAYKRLTQLNNDFGPRNLIDGKAHNRLHYADGFAINAAPAREAVPIRPARRPNCSHQSGSGRMSAMSKGSRVRRSTNAD